MNMTEVLTDSCRTILGCRQEGFPQTYLGLPLSCSKLRLSAFDPYICRTDRYLAGWQAALLNPMGRPVLVNTVLGGQLTHLMSALHLSPGAIAKFDKRRRSFLWTGEGTASGANCLIAWEKVRQDRTQGGLGIKDLSTQNSCLLLKLIHRLHQTTASSWATWVRDRVSLASMEGSVVVSHWDSLRMLLPIYQAITTVVLGNGKTTSFWHDVWHEDDCLADRFPAFLSHCTASNQTVCSIKNHGIEMHLVSRQSAAALEELQIVRGIIAGTQLTDSPDRRESPFQLTDGNLHSSSIYKLLRATDGDPSSSAAFTWRNRAPPRVQFFTWLLLNDRIQCKANLQKKAIVTDATCETCSCARETAAHIMFHCPYAQAFWAAIGVRISPDQRVDDLQQIQRPTCVHADHSKCFTILCCWMLWKRRNGVVFKGEQKDLRALLQNCRDEARLWGCRLPRSAVGVCDTWCSTFVNAM